MPRQRRLRALHRAVESGFHPIQPQRKSELEELPSKHVDTGMGLERITAVLQNVLSNYDIDYMRALTATTEKLTGKKYGADPTSPTFPSGSSTITRARLVS